MISTADTIVDTSIQSTNIHDKSSIENNEIMDKFLTTLSDLLDVDVDEAMNRLIDDANDAIVRECAIQLIEMVGVRMMKKNQIDDNYVERQKLYENILSYLIDICSGKEALVALLDLLQRLDAADSASSLQLFCLIALLIRKPILRLSSSSRVGNNSLVDALTIMVVYCQKQPIAPSYALENDECIVAENCPIANDSLQAVDALLHLMTAFVDECSQCVQMSTDRRRSRSQLLTSTLLRLAERPIAYWHVPDSVLASEFRRCVGDAVQLLTRLWPNRIQLYISTNNDNNDLILSSSPLDYSSLCCIGVIEYFCRIQHCGTDLYMVYSHEYRLDVCLPGCVALLSADPSHTAVCIKAIALLIDLLRPIASESITRNRLTSQPPTYQQLLFALTQLILSTTALSIRQQTLQCLERLFDCLDVNSKLAAIRLIFHRDGWSLSNRAKLFGWTIDYYRKCLLPVGGVFVDELSWILSLFCRVSLMTDKDDDSGGVVDNFDMHMAALNLLRMLALNRRRYDTEAIGELLSTVDRIYLLPLDEELMAASRSCPQQTTVDNHDMYASALLSIDLMRSVLMRVRELIVEINK